MLEKYSIFWKSSNVQEKEFSTPRPRQKSQKASFWIKTSILLVVKRIQIATKISKMENLLELRLPRPLLNKNPQAYASIFNDSIANKLK